MTFNKVLRFEEYESPYTNSPTSAFLVSGKESDINAFQSDIILLISAAPELSQAPIFEWRRSTKNQMINQSPESRGASGRVLGNGGDSHLLGNDATLAFEAPRDQKKNESEAELSGGTRRRWTDLEKKLESNVGEKWRKRVL